ncbi:MAG: topoisomerase DNA-binding C4 zinc finger domain-containing protein [Thermoplasmatota archaeon]
MLKGSDDNLKINLLLRNMTMGKNMKSKSIQVYCKGAVRGKDPQLTAYGFVVKQGESILKKSYGLLDIEGKSSNYLAEYRSLILGLRWIEKNIVDIEHLTIKTGSELVVNQVKGEWGVNSERLQGLYDEVKSMIEKLSDEKAIDVDIEMLPSENDNPAEQFTEFAFKDHSLLKQIKKEDEKFTKKCPKCGKEMVIREGKYGKFYGCKGYPECRYTEKYDE